MRARFYTFKLEGSKKDFVELVFKWNGQVLFQ